MIIFVNTDMFSNKKLFRDIFADHNISVMRIEGNRRSVCFTTNSKCSVDAKKMRKMKNFYATVILIRLKRISKFAFRGVLSLRYLFIRLFVIEIITQSNYSYSTDLQRARLRTLLKDKQLWLSV